MTNFEKLLLATCIVGVACLLPSCATVMGDFDNACKANTVYAYEEFLMKHPKSEFEQEARRNLEFTRWRYALETNTAWTYKEFLEKHPGSEFAEIAREKLDFIIWQHVLETNTPEAYEAYLSEYPTGRYVSEAKAGVEKAAYSKAQAAGTIEAIEEFLRKYPESRYSEKARIRINEIEKLRELGRDKWEETKGKNTLLSYVLFLKLFRNGAYKADAIKAIREILTQITMEAVDNDPTRIKKGDLFPAGILTLEEYKKAFARLTSIDIDLYRGSYTLKSSEGGLVISSTIMVESKGERIVIQPIFMEPLIARAGSLNYRGVAITFYREPMQRLVLVVEYGDSGAVRKVSIKGVGIAIIEKENLKEVYRFDTPLTKKEEELLDVGGLKLGDW